MKLIIDLGNTSQKYYLFEGKHLKDAFIIPGIPDSFVLKDIILKHGPFESAILSTVVDPGNEFLKTLDFVGKMIVFTPETPVPVGIDYLTPETLGSDRLAAAVAGHALFPGNPVLVIEAGTCIKYDLVVEGRYKGGLIAPGIIMQAKALNTFTEKLPLVNPEPGAGVPLTGTDTNSSLLSGIINTTQASMQGIISMYLSKYPDMKIVLSGGDIKYFDKMLKNSIFALPNIVAAGLNEILDFNNEENK